MEGGSPLETVLAVLPVRRHWGVPDPALSGSWNEAPPKWWRALPTWEDWGRRYAASGEDARRTVGPAIPGGDLAVAITEAEAGHEDEGRPVPSRRQLRAEAREIQRWGWIEAQRRALVERVLRDQPPPPDADRDEHAARLIRAQVKERLGCDLYEVVQRVRRELAPSHAKTWEGRQWTEAGRWAAGEDT